LPLQVLDDGRVTDSQGRVVSFKNTIIIMTSNLGSAAVFESLDDKAAARDMVMMAVRSHFRPEFINRIDEFISFDPLEQEQIKAIVRLQVRFGKKPPTKSSSRVWGDRLLVCTCS
jgi:ATP-dependent Clp protease ATP-binding subunit ClpB